MLRLLTILTLSVVSFAAFANEPWWTVQTVALRDYRQAQDTAVRLQEHGFPAYVEFAMNDGHQYSRVRVGCFTARDGARALAEILRSGITKDAVVVEASTEFRNSGRACTEFQTGFMKPASWEYVGNNTEYAVFEVNIGDITAFVTHNGDAWHVMQAGEELSDVTLADRSADWSQRALPGVQQALVMKHLEGSWWYACRGNLLGVFRDVAFVETSRAVVSCRYGGAG